MKIIKQYKVLGKIFDDEQDAIDYENSIRNNLELRARNLKIFYWRMLGYPGEYTAIELINHFCHYHKFNFGQWKDRYIGEIMMVFPRYIKWCIDNVSFFKLNKEEEALYNTSWTYSVGGVSWNITYDEVTDIPGDRYDHTLIDWEKEQLNKEKSII